MSAQFWDQHATGYDDHIQKHEGKFDQTITATKQWLKLNDHLLDFGCASGEYSLNLAPHVAHIQGIDLSSTMIKLAQQKAKAQQISNGLFDIIDLFDPQLEAGRFTAVLAFNVLHLVEDIPKALARLHTLLAPDGLLISQTPCLGARGSLFRFLIRFAQRVGYAPPIHSLTAAELETAVSHAKFNTLKSTLWDKKDAIQWLVSRKI